MTRVLSLRVSHLWQTLLIDHDLTEAGLNPRIFLNLIL